MQRENNSEQKNTSHVVIDIHVVKMIWMIHVKSRALYGHLGPWRGVIGC